MASNPKTAMCLLAGAMFANACFAQEEQAKRAETPAPRFYRLDVVIKEVENDKVVNSRSYATSIFANTREPASIRAGSRVPYVTGTASAKQYNYYDLGVNVDAREARELPSGQLTLNLNVDISSVVVTKESGGELPPTVRNTKWSSPVVVPIKKSVTVFSSDDPSGNRKMQLDLTATPIT